MKNFISLIKQMMEKYLWFSIIYSISVCTLVFVLMDIFVFHNFSTGTIFQALICGVILGYTLNKMFTLQEENKRNKKQ